MQLNCCNDSFDISFQTTINDRGKCLWYFGVWSAWHTAACCWNGLFMASLSLCEDNLIFRSKTTSGINLKRSGNEFESITERWKRFGKMTEFGATFQTKGTFGANTSYILVTTFIPTCSCRRQNHPVGNKEFGFGIWTCQNVATLSTIFTPLQYMSVK